MLQTKQLSLHLGGNTLFKDINISLDSRSGKKVALVGKNGCGKSSLLNILNGTLKSTEGSLNVAEEVIGYVPQVIALDGAKLVGEYLEEKLEETWMDYKIDTALSDVGLQQEYLIKEMSLLSGGEKVKVFLAGLLLGDATILLLDEPTNNLDTAGVMWLENFILNFQGSVIMVSHDRYLINRSVDSIWEIDPDTKGIEVYPGNYDNFLVEKEKRYEKKMMEYNHEVRQIEELDMWLRKNASHPKYRFSAIVANKKQKLEKLRKNQQDKPTHVATLRMHDPEPKTKGLVLKVAIDSKSFGEAQILNNLDFEMHKFDRLLITGKNGSGKTTLLRILTGEDTNFVGDITLGSNIEIGHLRQFSNLDQNKSILRVFEEETGIIEPDSRRVLARYAFDLDRVQSHVSTLSIGQLKRLDLAIILAKKPSLLILDEPTNHLDIYTREDLESFIKDQKIPMIVISHDRYFLDKVHPSEVINLD